MLRNYIVIAARNLLNSKLYTSINILGLSLGIGCCLVVSLFVLYELSYDHHHEKAEHIYRVVNQQDEGDHRSYVSVTQGVLAPELARNFGEIEKSTRIAVLRKNIIVEGKKAEGYKILAVDSSFFSMFTIPMKTIGGEKTVTHDGVFISEAEAIALFGKKDPVGQLITIEDFADVKIIGVFKDFPVTSHLRGDFISSFSLVEKNDPHASSWNFNSYYTYLLMPSSFDKKSFNEKMNTFIHQYTPESWKSYNYLLQPLLDIHMDNRYRATNANGSIGGMFVRIISAVGLVILALACFNYMNMATARSVKRSLEVGVRKVMGAHRWQLIKQFLTESMIICTLSFLLGILWADLAVPAFNAFTGWKLTMGSFFSDYRLVIALIAFNFGLAFIAGTYPAFFLSRFLPIAVLKGQKGTDSSRRLRKGLVLVQFSLTTILVIMVIVIFKQFNYMRTKDLGFNKEQLLLFNGDPGKGMTIESLKNELTKIPGVKLTATATTQPGNNVSTTEVWAASSKENNIKVDWLFIDHDYIPVMELKLIAGRNFYSSGSDKDKTVIINEKAAGILGWTPEEAIGKRVAGFIFSDSLPGEIVGVIKDYHVSSLKRQINALVIGYGDTNTSFIARLDGTNLFETRDRIEQTIKKVNPNGSVDPLFMNDFIELIYGGEKKIGQVIGFFTSLAILIGCSGLYALSAYEGEQRVKELGIRKIMGATSMQLMIMLSRNFLKLVAVSLVVALPLAYFCTNLWLKPFPYRVPWSAGIFIQAAVFILAISWITIIFQAIRSSRLNPADSLRHE